MFYLAFEKTDNPENYPNEAKHYTNNPEPYCHAYNNLWVLHRSTKLTPQRNRCCYFERVVALSFEVSKASAIPITHDNRRSLVLDFNS